MDAPLKELAKLERLAAGSSVAKGKAQSIDQSLDELLDCLRVAKERFLAGRGSQATLEALVKKIEQKKKEIDDKQKEVYNALAKFGKALDKKFPNPLPSYNPLFTTPEAKASLERIIAGHFLRMGRTETAQTFLSESNVEVDPYDRERYRELNAILRMFNDGDVEAPLTWVRHNREYLSFRKSPLEFQLHRYAYLRQILAPEPDIPAAIKYARTNFPPFYAWHGVEIGRLMNAPTYLPVTRFMVSPYADLANPSLQADLAVLFAAEYCGARGLSRHPSLKVVCDIGGGGALARIEKGRKVMRERKSEWSQTDELPIEIPLPPEFRYHSIFACPVSKEQATDANPPMMMVCGHVITKDSLQKLSKQGGRVKCPYCPTESTVQSALRVSF